MQRIWGLARAVVLERDGDTLRIRAQWEGAPPLELVEAELNSDIMTIARELARMAVRTSSERRIEAARPTHYADMVARLMLGLATPDERAVIEGFHTAVDHMRAEEVELLAFIDSAQSPDELNAYLWPEWVEWNPVPSRIAIEPL